jgi:hypothetical protein
MQYFIGNITRSNVSSARNMNEMFFGAFSFHGDPVINVNDMPWMFRSAS